MAHAVESAADRQQHAQIFDQHHSMTLRSLITVTCFFAATCVFLALRRPDQIAHPEVWNEDGLFVIPQIIQNGFEAVFWPVNGYLILPSRLITYLSLHISFINYPEVSTALGVAFQAISITLIAISPTFLPYRFLCAAVTIFLPMDAEVYVLPQYTFWWTTIFLFLVAIWIPGRQPVLRFILLVVGGLSTPLIVPISGILAVRAALYRSKNEFLYVLVAIAIGLVQLYLVYVGDPSASHMPSFSEIPAAMQRYLSDFTILGGTVWSLTFATFFGLLILGGFAHTKGDLRISYTMLLLILGVTALSPMLRIPIEIASPVGNGPRYFFLPLVIIAWLSIWFVARFPMQWKIWALAVALLSLPISIKYYQRGQQRLPSWQQSVRDCLNGTSAIFYIHHDGLIAHAHKVPYSHAVCKAGEQEALFN